MIRHAYGHKAPAIDHLKLALKSVSAGVIPLPPLIDQEPLCAPVIDQGPVGACTGCSAYQVGGILSARQIADGAWNGPQFLASWLATYALARQREGTLDEDGGASIADIYAVLSTTGLVPANDWTYDPSRVLLLPPANAIADAAKVKLPDFNPLAFDRDTMRAVLAQNYPIQVGVAVYESFEDAWQPGASGAVPMPNLGVEQYMGGHSIVIVGYDDAKQLWKFVNSWGTSVGLRGFGTLPYAYLTTPNLCVEAFEGRRLVQYQQAA